MRGWDLSRNALAIGAAAAFLAGCGGRSQPPIGTQGAGPQTSAIATANAHAKSRMLPGSASEDLIYATGECGGICVLTYPDGQLVAQVTVLGAIGADCSDKQGDVWVPNGNQVLEFRHGDTAPTATLSLPGTNARACSVDPSTGNLAVVFSGTGATVAVFSGATGTAMLYNSHMSTQGCGYNNAGNLFASGTNGQVNSIAQLPKNGNDFAFLTVKDKLGNPGRIQWDGSYITYEGTTKDNIKISRLHISGNKASVVGKTSIAGTKQAYQSWIYGDRVIVPYSTKGTQVTKIGIWAYPKSGKAVVKFGNFGQTIFTRFLGVALSPAD
jgi:hypothetical protein